VDHGSSLKLRKIQNCFLFIFREHNMACQSKHLEQFNGLIIDVGEDYLSAALFRDVNDAEQDRDADTVNEFGVAEVND